MAAFEHRKITTADGLKLNFRDYEGPTDQPPILCLPGLTRNARDFEGVADRLGGEWRIIAPDFRGRGRSQSDPNSANYRPATYVADMLKLLDQLGIADAVFFGTSLGGIVTMVLAHGDEERVAGALLNDIGPEVDPRGIERIRSYVGRPQNWASWAEAGAAFSEAQRDVFPDWQSADWERFARRTCRQDGNGQIVLDYDMAIAEPFATVNEGTQPNLWPLLGGLKGKPVTVLRGATSDLFSAEVAQRMIDELGSEAELVTVPGVGHAPTLEEAESVAAIDRLLARVKAREAAAPAL
jgi:pimeloyl-ACP methyl ester carboxylesterase